MTDWNERIARAKKALFTGALWSGHQIDALLDMFNALKDPEPAQDAEDIADRLSKKYGQYESGKQEPLVRNPDGKVWYISYCKDGDSHDGPHLFDYTCVRVIEGNIGCRPLRPFEAFRPGAMVERKYEDGDIYRGHIVSAGTNGAKVVCGGFNRSQPFGDLALVKPAPEGKA